MRKHVTSALALILMIASPARACDDAIDYLQIGIERVCKSIPQEKCQKILFGLGRLVGARGEADKVLALADIEKSAGDQLPDVHMRVAYARVCIPSLKTSEAGQVKVQELTSFTERHPSTIVVDVRTEEEFLRGHIPGAVHRDYWDPFFLDDIRSFERGQTYLLYCHAGERSRKAVWYMLALGFRRVHEIEGGIENIPRDLLTEPKLVMAPGSG